MYMRLLRLKILEGKSDEMRRFYEDRVLPELGQTPGCLFATLTEGVKGPSECLSLTLWDDQDSIQRYEEQGEFPRLIREAEPYLAESEEWRVQLSDDLTLGYGPAKAAPKISAYRLHAAMNRKRLGRVERAAHYLRVLRLSVAADRIPAARKRYREEVIPTLRQVKGCLYACLLSNLDSEGQLASLTIWESREDAERNERSETFQQLMRSARDIVGARSWDLMLESGPSTGTSPAGAVPTQAYEVVAGRDLGR